MGCLKSKPKKPDIVVEDEEQPNAKPTIVVRIDAKPVIEDSLLQVKQIKLDIPEEQLNEKLSGSGRFESEPNPSNDRPRPQIPVVVQPAQDINTNSQEHLICQ